MRKPTRTKLEVFAIATIFALSLTSCGTSDSSAYNSETSTWDSLQVTATAYNSLESQTKKGNPALAAWGDTLEPGMKCIAVSRDLIKMGFTHNKKVKIEGLDGVYLVKDKMNKRWTKKIDIYMGLDVEKAREWGKKKVKVYFQTEEEVSEPTL